MLPPKNDPFGAELRRLADSLDRERIRAVGEGLGIGSVRSVDKLRYERQVPQERFNNHERIQPQPNDEMDFLYSEFMTPLDEPVPHPHLGTLPPLNKLPTARETAEAPLASMPQDLVKAPKKSKLIRRMLGHGLDLAIVIGSLVGALVLVGLFVVPAPQGSRLVALMNWHPMRLLLGMHLFEFLFFVYFLFACYWGLFRLVVGQTIGGFFAAPRSSAGFSTELNP